MRRLRLNLSLGRTVSQVRRRRFLIGAGALFAAPLAAKAQLPAKVNRVGYVVTTAPVSELASIPSTTGFLKGMRELGYIEGKNLMLEWRSAEGKFERFPEIIRELVSIKVDVIVTSANPATRAAKDATRTVPIVMAASTIPVEAGLVQSLARPGGNITGLTLDASPEIFGKRIQLLKELFPKASRMAVLGFQLGLEGWRQQDAEVAGRALGTTLLFVEPVPTQFADAFALIAREHPDALLVAQSAPNYANRLQIAEFAAKARLPVMYPASDYVAAGGLISYGVDIGEVFRRAAGYVDRVLKGTKPGDMPVERPTNFELVINLKTAKVMGLTIPPSLLLRADRVIE